ncbi:OLC1v1027189C1 [Oldenlandia corymbosa var. corymbosa]|uniref:OLC1v1027189C1 n=1 Tax=Oldenlandia corymbosa var. corymbosa TaxID=529605 RepID=A0AAV1C9L5_OLDCO|nr:OLC1v1027189C1 [Oldenlandia corymbosa var. corymbosa]
MKRKSSYRTLQKKLKELKTEIYFAFSYPPPVDNADITNAQYHEVISEDIQQRIKFVKKLLIAEKASFRDPSKLQHLRHIAKKLAHLESLFHQWDDHRISTVTSTDHYDGVNHFGDAAAEASVCSCDDDDDVESCRDDDGDDVSGELGFSSVVYNEVDRYDLGSLDGLVDVKLEEDMGNGREKNRCIGADDDQVGPTVIGNNPKQKKGNNIGGGFCGGLITGMIFGTVLTASIMHRFLSDRQYIVIGDAFLFPT